MSKKLLNIVTNSYRAVSEEQDDTILWLVHAMQNNGGQNAVLLQGSGVDYLNTAQEMPQLQFGSWKQSNSADIVRDLSEMMKKGIAIFFVEEDVQERGLRRERVLPGCVPVKFQDLPGLFAKYDQIHRW